MVSEQARGRAGGETSGFRYLPGEEENRIAEQFDAWLLTMVERADEVLEPAEREAMFYYGFPGKYRADMSPLQWKRYLRGLVRGERWMLRWILENKPERFVEIGPGLGTWVFFAGLTGMKEVVGVDPFSRWLRTALKFAPVFNETYPEANVQFVHEDIYSYEPDGPVDIFYLKATIHHLYPLNPIFEYMHKHLRPGGIVVVHDPNGGNLWCQYVELRRRGLKLRETYTDPVSGKQLTMANEDLLTVPGLLYRFRKYGFTVLDRQGNLGLRTRASDFVYYELMRRLGKSFLLSTFVAPSYSIVAQKPA